MSQRVSGYLRKDNDAYFTPDWCTEALLPHLRVRPPALIHEPAAGNNAIVDVLKKAGYRVSSNDISRGVDFLAVTHISTNAIVTNPPYGLAEQFIAHALDLTEPHGLVCMLLR